MRPVPRFVAAIACALFAAASFGSPPAAVLHAQPNRPEPQQLTLDPSTTALLVLDLAARCNDPATTCARLTPVIKQHLPTYRASQVFTIFTVSAPRFGIAELWEGFDSLQPPNELLVTPDGTDKFVGGEIHGLLQERGIKTLIITGAGATGAVLYTASSAARNYGYDIIIPLDGTVADTDYEYEYVIHQFSVIPAVSAQFRFTTLDMIDFGAGRG